MENDNKEQNLKNIQNQRSNSIKSIIFIIVALLSVLILFWIFTSQPKGEEKPYNVFRDELEAGHVERVELNAKLINVKLKDGQWIWFYNRIVGEETVLADCTEYNKKVDEQNTQDPTLKLTKIEIIFGTTTTVSIINILYPIFLLLALGSVAWFVLRKIGNINSKSMEFTKNRARISASKVRFDKVAGADEEKEELEEIIQFLKDPEKFTKIGARIPKGVLLVGPPGTGKTLLARAVAGEANVPFFTISGSDFMELYVGVGASRVRDLFENAKKAKPCIVFIDEIDAVGRQRGTGLGGGNDEREQTLNQLLVQMDGFEPNEGIIVMAATNRADILDPALTRPGRFDRQIYINTPDVKGREEILRVHSQNKPLDTDVKLKEVARVTSGFTGADLENLLNEAAILAARQNRNKITMEDINNAVVKVTMGPQKRSRVVTESDKKITAYHEAGHAVVEKCIKTSNPVHEVSIVQRGGAAGYTISRPDNDDSHVTKQKLIDTITMMLGGRSAEAIFLDDITTGASSDINQATNLARRMVTEWGMSSEIGLVNHGEGSELFLGRDYQSRVNYSEKEASIIDSEIKKIIDQCYIQAKDILNKNKNKIETMVKVLLEKETIYADEVDMIMSGASAEEVIKLIDEKANTKKSNFAVEKRLEDNQTAENDLNSVDNQNKDSSKQNETSDYVDFLMKQAKKRAEELKVKTENEVENKDNVDSPSVLNKNISTQKVNGKANEDKNSEKNSSTIKKSTEKKSNTKSSSTSKSTQNTKKNETKTTQKHTTDNKNKEIK